MSVSANTATYPKGPSASLELTGYQEIELTPKRDDHFGCVYILFVRSGGIEVPFYIGQSKRFYGRMDDYFWASFAASTDFRVGKAIQYFCRQEGFQVFAKYKICAEPPTEEKVLIKEAERLHLNLLNNKGYDYKAATDSEQKVKVEHMCEEILSRLKSDLAQGT